MKERVISLSRYNTVSTDTVIQYSLQNIQEATAFAEVCTNRKCAPFQVLLIFRLPGEVVPSTTRKSRESITNVRLQGRRQLFIKLVDSRANSIQW